MRYFYFLVFSMMSSLAFAQDLEDYSAKYQIEMNGLQAGELTQQLETLSDGLHRFRSVTKAKGVVAMFRRDTVKETSLWTLADQQIQPHQYLYQRNGGKKDKYLRMDFDWPANKVQIDDKVHPWELDIESGTLEKHIYQVQLRLDLQQDPDQKVFNYLIADGGRIKHYQIERLEQETISTPLGKIDTVKFTRQRDRDSDKDRETTLWCAPELGYLPVKLEHIEKDGTKFTAVLRSLEGMQNSAFEQNK
ncbi:DUF3108 domain-containing protein [Methylophaga muralis]|uniref:Isoprenoid biosynthesis protein n=1 Tax=Methylophaga muralis TaxID=291169 RepID=A0A1E3GU01_9GAMM|nr:DUF3108 domain-containing protein [Methylophaga muralis]ODN67523.1 hypothetical protein A9E74_00868 [Methylophaga muralis]